MISTYAKQFLRDESGATAIEYGLIAAGIALAVMATVTTLGETLKTKFGDLEGKIAEMKPDAKG